MKWFWRAIAGIAVLAVFLVAAGVVWASIFFDPEVYRDRLIAWVTDRTGSTFTLDGELEVDFDLAGRSSAVTIFLGDLAIGNPPGFAGDKIFRAVGMSVEIPVWHLLKGHVYPNITVHQPQLRLIRAHPNRTNWQPLVASMIGRGEPIHEWDLIKGFAGIAVTGLRVFDGAVHWMREDTGDEITILDIDFEMASLFGKQPARLQTQLVLEHNALAKPLAIDAAVTVEREARSGVVRAEKMQLEVAAPGVLITLNALEMDNDPVHRRFRLRQAAVTGAVGNDEFRLAVEAAEYQKPTDRLIATAVTGNWIGAGMEGRAELASIFVHSLWDGVIFPGGRQKTSVRFGDGQSSLEWVSKAVVGSGKIFFSVLNWSTALAKFGMSVPVERMNALAPVDGSAEFSIGKRGIEIQHFDLDWGESKFSGSLTQTPSGRSRLEFELIETQLELERSAPRSPLTLDNDPGIAVLALLSTYTGLDAIGNIQIQRLRWRGLEIKKLYVPVKFEAGRVQVDAATFGLYGGTVRATALIDRATDRMGFETRQEYTNVEIGSLLGAIGMTEQIKALGNLTFTFQTVGEDWSSWLEAARARARFGVPEGRIRGLGRMRVFGVKVDQYIRQARTAMGLQSEWPDLESGISFSNLQATMTLRGGEIWTDDFVAETLGLKISGRGKYILSSDEFDSLWHVRWDKPIQGSGLTLFDQAPAMVVPFRVTGRGGAMSVVLDIPELLRLLSE